MGSHNSFESVRRLEVAGKNYTYFSLPSAQTNGLAGISSLPISTQILLENLLRHEDGKTVTRSDISALAGWSTHRGTKEVEIAFRPARVLMQDFTGVPAIVDLAAMRDAVQALGGDLTNINPLIPVDLVIDHSVIVDEFGTLQSLAHNVEKEYARNKERYRFLKWGQRAFKNFRVVPPGTGICHQVNLEYLAKTIWTQKGEAEAWAYPDTLVGTDSHTTMVNGLSVLGWGVGGIEAEACMLGQPLSMLLPEVIGVRLEGALREGVTATDLVLTLTQRLRQKGVVGKFVEFYGPGLPHLTLADRATLSNMAPEYGATCGFFPTDDETLRYLTLTHRSLEQVELVRAYTQAQGWFYTPQRPDPLFTDIVPLNLAEIEPSVAGPKRPEGRVALSHVAQSFATSLTQEYKDLAGKTPHTMHHGDVVIAAITSCTNTSNPHVLIAAGLLARKARARGLRVKPWVKTSLAPGSQVVAAYLETSGLQADLDALGFQIVGFGCTTCIGNSGTLAPDISQTIQKEKIIAAAVLSGNRNFEGRVNPDVQANYLASPPLVVAYALAGSVTHDLTKEPLGQDLEGKQVYLKDIWPSSQEIAHFIETYVRQDVFATRYAHVFEGDAHWKEIDAPHGETYAWDDASTYIRNPPYFEKMTRAIQKVDQIKNARILALFGDKITTDHISPAGSIKVTSPAGTWLQENGVAPLDFNQYGTRRGNHEVMMRGAFANIRIKNYLLQDANGHVPEGGQTLYFEDEGHMTPLSIYDAAMRYHDAHIPLVIFAGAEYGNGSSRDWAAKGTRLLGVRAVIAQSFERIHRSNLVGMGVLPLTFEPGVSWRSLGLTGQERIDLEDISTLHPRQSLTMLVRFRDNSVKSVPLICQITTLEEIAYFQHGGILPYVIRHLID